MMVYHQHTSTIFHRVHYVALQRFLNRPEQKKTNNNHLSYFFLFYRTARPVASQPAAQIKLLYFLIGQMVVAKALSRLYADMLLYGQSIVYNEHCVSVSRELKDKRLEGEHLEILSSLYLSLNTERLACASPSGHKYESTVHYVLVKL